MGGVELEEIDVVFSKEECERSLAGRIYGDKQVNFVGFRNTMTAIWPVKEPFKLRELGRNLFQIVFSSQEDLKRILNGKAWTFDQQYLVLKEWRVGMNIKSEILNSVDIWVQIWGIPTHWMAKEVGVKIDKLFVQVRDVILLEYGSSNGRPI